jgi:7-cyano-7-deazaguanine synthase
MSLPSQRDRIGLLLSGGLDSSILLAHLLEAGHPVQPFYVRTGVVWESEERAASERFMARLACPGLQRLVTFDMPLADVYGDHWSLTGRETPDASTPDEAVYLPGRNALLALKAVVWCKLHGIDRLALAPLASNPFEDATDEFFAELQSALGRGAARHVRITRPFGHMHKRDVMLLGRHLPLELTFSCIAPVGGAHCGASNKCAERRAAFGLIDLADPTMYAAHARQPATTG